MQLKDIDKATYRQHFKYTTFAVIAGLMVGALSISSLLILFLGNNEGSNFNLNLAGVAITIVILAIVASQVKSKPYFAEILYVSRLKFELSHINRKFKAIEKAAKSENTTALDILAFYYQATRQVWTLDDNTITMSELNSKEAKFFEQVNQLNYQADANRYSRDLLAQFS
ncbi:MAG: hypothetical protein BM565_04645 [Gammaproteobacteria bacterium MedPE]|nr:MAG: hypothetical protein BM565_04645 [Gammaproteobacteria bacterium MedPE]